MMELLIFWKRKKLKNNESKISVSTKITSNKQNYSYRIINNFRKLEDYKLKNSVIGSTIIKSTFYVNDKVHNLNATN